MATRKELEQGRAQARAANSRRRKRRRRGRRRTHFILLTLFLLGLGSVLSFTVFFKIQAVRVVGTDKYDPDLIAADSGVELESNLLRIDKEGIAQRIMERYPYIESVEVHRKLPPAVEIAVTQSVPDGAIRMGDEIVLITKEGKVLERGMLLIPETVPLVKGIEAAGTRPGEYLPEEQEEKLIMLRNLLAAIEETGFENITNVDLTDRLNIQIIYENRIVLKLGVEVELVHKLQSVQYVLEEKIGPGERGTLDASEVNKWTIFSPTIEDGALLEQSVGSEAAREENAEERAGEDDAPDDAENEEKTD